MNNEPVAHFYPEGEGCTVYDIKFAWKVTGTTKPIPLYTHPAKESKAKDRFSNYESICLQCGITIYKPAFNTLTDEEILEFRDKVPYTLGSDLIEFARAILRKASEK